MQRRRTSNGDAGSIRIGPVAVITLITVLSLSVLAVLALVDARSSYTEADRQQQIVAASYSNEFNANTYLAQIDRVLKEAREDGATADESMDRVEEACPEGALVKERDVTIALTTKVGRTLTIKIHVNDDLTYTITQWTAEMQLDDDGSAEKTSQ